MQYFETSFSEYVSEYGSGLRPRLKLAESDPPPSGPCCLLSFLCCGTPTCSRPLLRSAPPIVASCPGHLLLSSSGNQLAGAQLAFQLDSAGTTQTFRGRLCSRHCRQPVSKEHRTEGHWHPEETRETPHLPAQGCGRGIQHPEIQAQSPQKRVSART